MAAPAAVGRGIDEFSRLPGQVCVNAAKVIGDAVKARAAGGDAGGADA